MIKKAVKIPVMVKLAIDACDPYTSIQIATDAGADAVGPTARWKAFLFDLDWRGTQANPGGGYGGTQALPIVCYSIAEARSTGIETPMYAGGGVFSYSQALKIIMAGSQCVQIGSLACSGGIKAVGKLIADFEKWMDSNGYKDMDSLCGEALRLFSMPADLAEERIHCIGQAYKSAAVIEEKCIGCGRCEDVCWHDGIKIAGNRAKKTDKCIGCGYCFQVCPTQALYVNASEILSSVFRRRNI